MKLDRSLVLFGAVAFAGFGVYGLVQPLAVFDFVHGRADHVDTINDLRAVYGGVQLGLATFLANCVAGRWPVRAGLFLQTALLGWVVLARGISFAIDGTPTGPMLVTWAVEVALALLGGVALRSSSPRASGDPR